MVLATRRLPRARRVGPWYCHVLQYAVMAAEVAGQLQLVRYIRAGSNEEASMQKS